MLTIGTRSNRLRGVFATALVVGLFVPAVVAIAPARAATETFSESFRGATLGDPSDWIASKAGTEDACLTGLPEGSSINLSTGVLIGCPGAGDGVALDATPGTGVLRLTDESQGQSTLVLYREPQRMSDGLDITFSFAMHSGTSGSGATGADGFSFFIKDGRNTLDQAGVGGGGLGYALSAFGETLQVVDGRVFTGVPGGLLGVGFDFYGAFSLSRTPAAARACGASDFDLAADSTLVHDRIVLRGPDTSDASPQDGTCGYEYLGRSTSPADFGRETPGDGADPAARNRADASRRARVVIDKPGEDASVKVYVWRVGQSQPAVPILDLPQPPELQGVPTFKFGFSAGTGSATNVHEIWDLQIVLADPVVQAQQAAASTTAAAPAGPDLACVPDPVTPGAEVTCTVTSGPAEGDILWRAAIGGRVVGTRGVTLGADGTGTFTFRAPSDAAGATIGVELVDWGVTDDVGVVGGPVPTRVDAGLSSRLLVGADASLVLAAGFLLLSVMLRRRSTATR